MSEETHKTKDEESEMLWKKIKELQKKKEQVKLEVEEAERQQQEAAAAEKAKQLEEQQQQQADGQKEEKQSYQIFVGKLHHSVNKEKLLKHFECCGQITKATIMENHYTHQSRGFGYLTFADKTGFDNALKLNGTLLESQTIEVKEKRDNKPNMGRRMSRFVRRRFRRM